jgi:hypothetical protein
LYNVLTWVTLLSLHFIYENNVTHVKTGYTLWLP